jgi:hypothetical protein
MKCFRQVTAEVKGVIKKVCMENNNPVAKRTTLFLIRPESLFLSSLFEKGRGFHKTCYQ